MLSITIFIYFFENRTYELTINKGSVVNKKILYLNLKEDSINYKVCSSMPNIIEVKTETINL